MKSQIILHTTALLQSWNMIWSKGRFGPVRVHECAFKRVIITCSWDGTIFLFSLTYRQVHFRTEHGTHFIIFSSAWQKFCGDDRTRMSQSSYPRYCIKRYVSFHHSRRPESDFRGQMIHTADNVSAKCEIKLHVAHTAWT